LALSEMTSWDEYDDRRDDACDTSSAEDLSWTFDAVTMASHKSDLMKERKRERMIILRGS
jgi:cation transport regulator ChaB